MNAIVTNVRPYIDMSGESRLELTVTYYGSPMVGPEQQQSIVSVPLAPTDSANAIGTKVNAAVDAEARRFTAALPGGSITPATTFAPSYIKLR